MKGQSKPNKEIESYHPDQRNGRLECHSSYEIYHYGNFIYYLPLNSGESLN